MESSPGLNVKDNRKSLLNSIIKEVSVRFSEWVIEGGVYEVDYSCDPPWDHSGHLIECESDEDRRLQMYETLGEWMDDCRTGNSTPSFESGCGLYHDWFEHEISSLIQSTIERDLICERGLKEDADDSIEAVADEAVQLLYDIMPSVEKFATELAWEIGERPAREGIADETVKQEARWRESERLCQIAKSFNAVHFKDREGSPKIEWPGAKQFLSRCAEVFKGANKEELKAILENGVYGSYSNKVSEEIAALAKKEYTKRA